jgi:hypothetical protein
MRPICRLLEGLRLALPGGTRVCSGTAHWTHHYAPSLIQVKRHREIRRRPHQGDATRIRHPQFRPAPRSPSSKRRDIRRKGVDRRKWRAGGRAVGRTIVKAAAIRALPNADKPRLGRVAGDLIAFHPDIELGYWDFLNHVRWRGANPMATPLSSQPCCRQKQQHGCRIQQDADRQDRCNNN